MVCDWLAAPIASGLIKKYEQKRVLVFHSSGGRIEARTGKKPDHLRGGWGDYIILDEYAYQNPTIYQKVCLPMVLDTDGTLIIISTPDKRNHFYHLYLKALEDQNWEVFTFSSLENPFLSPEALDTLTADMVPIDYRQEILAEFVPGIGQVFILDQNDFYPGENASNHAKHRIVAGLDWGRKQDYTALSVGCADCMKELSIDKIKDFEYHIQREFILDILGGYAEVELLAEENAMGLPNIEELRRDIARRNLKISVIPFNTNNTNKGTLVQSLRLAFNQHDWKWIEDRSAWNELEAFEMTISPSGLARFSAPEGLNDDTVMSRMLMLYQAIRGRISFY